MAETIVGLKRTAYCGTFREEHAGQQATVYGWVQRQRDLGQLIFVDLRDRTGIVQLAFDQNTDKAVFEKAFSLRSEYVVAARGVVRVRSSRNADIPTGDVEMLLRSCAFSIKRRRRLSRSSRTVRRQSLRALNIAILIFAVPIFSATC